MSLSTLQNWPKGKKSYLLAVGVIAYQVLGHYLYSNPFDAKAVTEALGLATLRAAIAKGAGQ